MSKLGYSEEVQNKSSKNHSHIGRQFFPFPSLKAAQYCITTNKDKSPHLTERAERGWNGCSKWEGEAQTPLTASTQLHPITSTLSCTVPRQLVRI